MKEENIFLKNKTDPREMAKKYDNLQSYYYETPDGSHSLTLKNTSD